MKARLADLLVCPIDGTPLELIEWESRDRPLPADEADRARAMGIDPVSLGHEILTGLLVNRTRRVLYPIHGGVPRMLTFPTGVARHFVATYRERLEREVPGLALPAQPPTPGEEDVLRSFSAEWLNYGWNTRTYWDVDAESMFESMRYMLDLDAKPQRGQRYLEVGIGIGGIADFVARRQGCELIGTDLSYAVDAAYRHFAGNPFLHIVQSSLFAPPVRDGSIDFVYSHGVIHHTYATRAAFDRISRLPKPGGRLYVWVYSPVQESRTLARRVLMGMERALRPVLWRLPGAAQTLALSPIILLYVAQKNLLSAAGRRSSTGFYGWREAEHAARDRFTPRFAHRHDDAEVESWFGAAGYRDLKRVRQRPAPAVVPPHFLACTGVEGTRGG